MNGNVILAIVSFSGFVIAMSMIFFMLYKMLKDLDLQKPNKA